MICKIFLDNFGIGVAVIFGSERHMVGDTERVRAGGEHEALRHGRAGHHIEIIKVIHTVDQHPAVVEVRELILDRKSNV